MLKRILLLITFILSACVPYSQPTPEPTPTPTPHPPYLRTLEQVGLPEGETALLCPPTNSCLAAGRDVAVVGVDSLSNPTRLTLAFAPIARDAGLFYPQWEESSQQTFALQREGNAFWGHNEAGELGVVITRYGGWEWDKDNQKWRNLQPSSDTEKVLLVSRDSSAIPQEQEVPVGDSPFLQSLFEPRPLSEEIPSAIPAGLTAGGEFLSEEQLREAFANYRLFYDQNSQRVLVLPNDERFLKTGDWEVEAAIYLSVAKEITGLDPKAGSLVIPHGDEFLVVGKDSRGKGVVYRLYRQNDRWSAYNLGHPENPTLGDIFFHPQLGVIATDGGFNITHRYNPETKKWEWLGGEDGNFVAFETTADWAARATQTLEALTGLCKENYSGWETWRNPYKIAQQDVENLIESLREGKVVEGVEVEETDAYAIYHTSSVSVFVDRRGKWAVYILTHGGRDEQEVQKYLIFYQWFAEMWKRLTTEEWLPPEVVLQLTQYTPVGGPSPTPLGNRTSSHTIFSCKNDNNRNLVFGATYYPTDFNPAAPELERINIVFNVWMGEALEEALNYHGEIKDYFSSYLKENLPPNVHPEVSKRLKSKWVVVPVGANFWFEEIIEKTGRLPPPVKKRLIQTLIGERRILLETDYLATLQ